MRQDKNYQLDVSDSYDQFFEDTCLIGVVTSFKSYRFCLQVNKTLDFNFRLNTNIEILLNKKNRNYYFPVYQSNVRYSCVEHYLYDNRNDGEVLLPGFKNIDFIWLVKEVSSLDGSIYDVLSAINAMDGIQLATEIEYGRVNHRENLIF